jgi:hypothetical protein
MVKLEVFKMADDQNPDPDLLKMQEITRFGIAAIVLIVFGVALAFSFYPVYGTQPSVIISAFSGWVAALIAFYFAGQSVDSAKKAEADAKARSHIIKKGGIAKLVDLNKSHILVDDKMRAIDTKIQQKILSATARSDYICLEELKEINTDLDKIRIDLNTWNVDYSSAMQQMIDS